MEVQPVFPSSSTPDIKGYPFPQAPFEALTSLQVVNTTPVLPNYSINYTYAVKPFMDKSHTGLCRNQFAFMKKNTQDLSNSLNVYTCVNLATLNCYLAAESKNKPDLRVDDKFDQYSCIGVIVADPRHDADVSNEKARGYSTSVTRKARALERQITTTSRGLVTSVANIFKRTLFPGERLYFIWKRVDMVTDIDYQLTAEGVMETVERPPMTISSTTGRISNRHVSIIQVFPFASRSPPTWNDLVYTNSEGVEEIGRYICVGRVEDSYSNPFAQCYREDYKDWNQNYDLTKLSPFMTSADLSTRARTFSAFLK